MAGQPEDSDSYVNRIDIIFIKILNSAFIFFYLTFFILELLIFMFFYRTNLLSFKVFTALASLSLVALVPWNRP